MRKVILALAAAGLIAGAVPAGAAANPDESPVAVCNEAENSWHGGYVVEPGVDPDPPSARADSQRGVVKVARIGVSAPRRANLESGACGS